ncbi:MAG: hypothetical protein GY910_28070 [bacterium]|nr:hypothetical protein [bacterium]
MWEAMANARVGDDVHGEDPTVNELEERVVGRVGMETALCLPNATQANLVAVLSHCGRGGEFSSGVSYHVFQDEAGGASALGASSAIRLPSMTRDRSARSGQPRRSPLFDLPAALSRKHGLGKGSADRSNRCVGGGRARVGTADPSRRATR